MRNIITLLIITASAILLLAACGDANNDNNENVNEDVNNNANNEDSGSDEALQVITTFTLIEDIVKQIGGDLVETHNMVPIGTDPHEYDPLSEDIQAATDADIVIYNGFNLEGDEEDGWLAKLADSVDRDYDEFYELMEGAEPAYLSGDDGEEDEINPHTFLDPVLGIQMAENTLDALVENLPDHEEELEEKADEYIAELEEIDKEYEEKINEIPEEDRILVTSERAYQYMAERYGLKEGFVFQIDTEEQGTPEQISSLVEFVNEEEPPALFVETNVDDRSMETISEETGVEIHGGIFSDEIGKPGEEGDTYVKFLKYNIEQIYEGLMD